MGLYLGHTTALLALRTVGAGHLGCTMRAPTAIPETYVLHARDLHDADLTWRNVGLGGAVRDDPVDLMVPTQQARHLVLGSRQHVLGTHSNRALFYRLSSGQHVATPELCFVQMCNAATSLLPLIELADELCGTYTLTATDPYGFVSHAPLTTRKRIAAFLEVATGMHGSKAARRALAWSVDGAASPKESQARIALSIRERYGGYGFGMPLVNARIDVTGDARRMTSRRTFYVDLLFPDEMVIVEYDGARDHEDATETVERDKERRSVLEAMGYTVIVITRMHTGNFVLFEQKAEQIARALGKRIRHDEQSVTRRRLLQEYLFRPDHQQGGINAGAYPGILT